MPRRSSNSDWSRRQVRGLATTLVRRYLVLSALVGLLAGGLAFSVAPAVAAASPAWTLRPGCAIDIGMGADGSVWVVGCDTVPGGFSISRWNGSGWARQPGGAISIGVDPSGNAWITNDAGNIYRWSGSGWARLPGCAFDIDVGGAAGTSGTAWVTGCDGVAGGLSISRWNGSGWARQPGGGVWMGVDPSGNAWMANDTGNIYRWSGSGWARLPGCANEIDVGGAAGASTTAWVIGCDTIAGGFSISRWNGSGWARQAGGGESIAVDPSGDHPWMTNDTGNIYSS